MARKRNKHRAIVLPWEQQGAMRRPTLSRMRTLVWVLIVLAFFLGIAHRERTQAGIRSTRASLLIVRRAIDAYRADHEGKCPANLAEVKTKGYLREIPADAWGAHLVLTCPARLDAKSYDLASPGPDGVVGGLDRID